MPEDTMEKARELLAAEYAADGLIDVAAAILGNRFIDPGNRTFRAIAAAIEGAVPAGWRLVPEIATSLMREVGADNLFGASQDDWGQEAAEIYAAMLAAAPRVEEVKDEG